MEIKRFTVGDEERWDRFVSDHDKSTFFHRAGWREVVHASFGHECPYMYAEQDGEVVGILPLVEIRSRLFGHSIISNGFSVCGGPIGNTDEIISSLTAAAVAYFQETGADYLEYRCPAKLEPGWASKDDLYAGFSRHIETEEDKNLTQIPRKQRAVLRKALKSDITARFDDTVDTLYALYALSVRNLGTPVFGKTYFSNLFDIFGDECRVLTVYGSNDEPLSSVMNFYFKNTVLPFYTGAKPEARRVGASDYQYWQTMRDAVERGYTVFDFGRSKVGTGPYRFKKNWGFEPTPLTHQFLVKDGQDMPNVNPTNPKYSLFIGAWKKLPLPVANLLGPWIVRNIG